MGMDRTYWYSNAVHETKLSDGNIYDGSTNEIIVEATKMTANLISSQLSNGNHAPALDIDMPCQLIPSQTPGHFHLYIAKEMSWRKYKKLLRALADAGILEKNYVKHSLKKKKTCLRVPKPIYKKEIVEITA